MERKPRARFHPLFKLLGQLATFRSYGIFYCYRYYDIYSHIISHSIQYTAISILKTYLIDFTLYHFFRFLYSIPFVGLIFRFTAFYSIFFNNYSIPITSIHFSPFITHSNELDVYNNPHFHISNPHSTIDSTNNPLLHPRRGNVAAIRSNKTNKKI